ncbi:unnamed protein product [Malus baccata var. baccata]
MSKFFKSESDNFGKVKMSCDWEGNIILIYFSKQFTYLHFSTLCIQEVSSVREDLEVYVLRLISSVVDVKFTSQDGCNNAYFSLKALSVELPESVIEALHDESDIGLIHYSHPFLLLILIVYGYCLQIPNRKVRRAADLFSTGSPLLSANVLLIYLN